MKGIPRSDNAQGDYSKIEGNGLMQGYQQAGPALEQALANRRQKLAGEKMGLQVQPGEQSEE